MRSWQITKKLPVLRSESSPQCVTSVQCIFSNVLQINSVDSIIFLSSFLKLKKFPKSSIEHENQSKSLQTTLQRQVTNVTG